MFGSSVYWLTPSPTFYLVTHRLTIEFVNTPSNAGNPKSYEYAIYLSDDKIPRLTSPLYLFMTVGRWASFLIWLSKEMNF